MYYSLEEQRNNTPLSSTSLLLRFWGSLCCTLHKFPSRSLFFHCLHQFLHKLLYFCNLISTNTLWNYSQNKTPQTRIVHQRQLNSAVVLIKSFFSFVFSLVHCTSQEAVSVIILEPTVRSFKTTIALPWYYTQSHTQRLALQSLLTSNPELSLLSSPTSSNHSLSNLLEFSLSNSLTWPTSLPMEFTNLWQAKSLIPQQQDN